MLYSGHHWNSMLRFFRIQRPSISFSITEMQISFQMNILWKVCCYNYTFLFSCSIWFWWSYQKVETGYNYTLHKLSKEDAWIFLSEMYISQKKSQKSLYQRRFAAFIFYLTSFKIKHIACFVLINITLRSNCWSVILAIFSISI